MVRSAGRWVMCDDENIEPIDEKDIFRYFGDYPSGAGYVLFYQAVDLDLRDLGMKNPPKPPTPAAPSRSTVPTEIIPATPPALATPILEQPPTNANVNGNGVPNLMDVEEEHEEPPSKPVSAQPVHVPFIAPRPPSTPATTAATPAATPGSQTPASSAPISNGTRDHSSERGTVDRQIGFTPSSNVTPSVRTDASSTASREAPKSMAAPPPVEKVKRVPPPPPKSRSASSNMLSTTASKPAPSMGTSTSVNGLSTHAAAPASVPPIASTTAPTPPRIIATPAPAQSPNAMSSSMMSNFSQSSSTGSSAPPPSSNASAGQSSLGRKPSSSGRDRNVSASSGTSYNGGGGLGRRLSGMSGKFKMGFGKKSKDRENGIEEEDHKKTERKGLLG